MNVMVGLATENEPKPNEESVVVVARLSGGVALPSPSAGFVGKICSVPTPEISIRSDPYTQVPETPLKVPPKVVASPTGDEPAVVITPAPFTQYAGPDCRHGSAVWIRLIESFCVSVPV